MSTHKPATPVQAVLGTAAFVALLVGGACSGGSQPQATATLPPATPTTAPSRTPTATVPAGQPSVTSTAAPVTPPATATRPAPTPTTDSRAPSIAYEHGARDSGHVALTFDMGGRVEPAVAIVTWLIENRVPATIFITGAMVDNVNTDAGRTVLGLVRDHPDLLSLGNHSYSHPDFRDLTATDIEGELLRTETSVGNASGLSTRPLFCPPFGGVNAGVLGAVGGAGFPVTVLWDIDTID